MEHELREDGELGRQAERRRVVGTVVGELGAQTDERAVDPAQHVRHRLGVTRSHQRHLLQQTLRGESRDHDGGALLVEGGGHGRHVGEVHVPATADGGHAHADAAVGVRVGGHELQAATAVLDGGVLAVGHLEVEGECGRGIQQTQVPADGAALADLQLADGGASLLLGDAGTDTAADLELFGGLHLDGGAEAHHQVAGVYVRDETKDDRSGDSRQDTPRRRATATAGRPTAQRSRRGRTGRQWSRCRSASPGVPPGPDSRRTGPPTGGSCDSGPPPTRRTSAPPSCAAPSRAQCPRGREWSRRDPCRR